MSLLDIVNVTLRSTCLLAPAVPSTSTSVLHGLT